MASPLLVMPDIPPAVPRYFEQAAVAAAICVQEGAGLRTCPVLRGVCRLCELSVEDLTACLDSTTAVADMAENERKKAFAAGMNRPGGSPFETRNLPEALPCLL